MLTQTKHWFPLEPLLHQVQSLPDFDRLAINETDGDLLSGKYTVKKEFVGTPLGDVLEQLGDVGEARLMRLRSAEVYTAHCDPDDRYHLTITTNPHCYLVDLRRHLMHHVAADGWVWSMDTGVKHSAMNLGSGDRIHLNIRHRLPEYKKGGYRMTFTGPHDWKQTLYIYVLGYINRAIKLNYITGIAKTAENEILVNVVDEKIIGVIDQIAKGAGLDTVISQDE